MKKTDNVIRFDWAAKYMLRDKASFGILEGFLGALLNEEVRIVELLESESHRQNRNAKSNRVEDIVNTARQEGLAIGERQGKKLGLSEGKKLGLVEGHAAERESLIRRMKAAGLSADLIETITNG